MGKSQNKSKQKKDKNEKHHINIERQSRHLFTFKPIKNPYHECYYKKTIVVDFSPIKTEVGIQQISLPIFNRDRRHWTKAFVIGLRKDYYMSKPLKQKQKFAEKYRRKTQQQNISSHTSFMYHQQPQPKSQYCYVCQTKVKDNYYGHIHQKEHRELQDNNIATQYIYDMVENYKRQNGRSEITPTKCQKNNERVEKMGERTKAYSTRSQERKEKQLYKSFKLHQ